ncbi:kinase-like protein [Mytilinidion resinicola]|uniref:Kinase-like protein n=1 Tax=Mytilinidion resinicola TaxID=574789 RepID=A0A6A6YCK4_9PEZI|nr:kinase-like protein [Mytilinidion resinicola]KAF2806243.1 kinase-like protein [Mytilinidion resinicola]
MVNFDDYTDSYGRYSSLATDQLTTQFQSSATVADPQVGNPRYGFIAVLGLAQRFKVDFLPIKWNNPLDLIGKGGQARVNHTPMSVQMSFAFKRFQHEGFPDPFREVVQELLILTHPSVRHHKHIIHLEGIVLDIVAENKIWPVLVFEKTHFEDLYKFAKSGIGREMSIDDRLALCVDIGVAIRDMHANGIIHGDIKPHNILVFPGSDGKVTAKVADFGFATWFRSRDDLIAMPRSVPWNAPEHRGQKFRPLDAQRMDVYSYGMLCLWLLFGVDTPENVLLPLSTILQDDQTLCFDVLGSLGKENLLLIWKMDENDKLLDWATWLVLEHTHISATVQRVLLEFFRSSLSFHSSRRTTDLDHLLCLLAPMRSIPETNIVDRVQEQDAEDFQVR